jgi:hypothetical protein
LEPKENNDVLITKEIDKLLVNTKQGFSFIFSKINSLSHEDNKREFNKMASKIYNDFQTLQSYISSR